MIDQFRTQTQMTPLNMRHVFETQLDLSDSEVYRVKNAKASDMVSLVSGTECQAQEPYLILYDANFPKYREDVETSMYACTFYGRDHDNNE
eukprot:9682407-Karenia_brevis.AAC.1